MRTNKRISKLIFFVFLFSLVALLLENDAISKETKTKHLLQVYGLVIAKHDFKIYLKQGNKIIKKYPIAVGKYYGDKQKEGDCRTPEGEFFVNKIENSRNWVHDFKDGKGPIKGAYGPWFFGLYTGADRTVIKKSWKGIGIHGTHDPSSIGKMVSEGCIRMRNEDIEELRRFVKIGTSVSIGK